MNKAFLPSELKTQQSDYNKKFRSEALASHFFQPSKCFLKKSKVTAVLINLLKNLLVLARKDELIKPRLIPYSVETVSSLESMPHLPSLKTRGSRARPRCMLCQGAHHTTCIPRRRVLTAKHVCPKAGGCYSPLVMPRLEDFCPYHRDSPCQRPKRPRLKKLLQKPSETCIETRQPCNNYERTSLQCGGCISVINLPAPCYPYPRPRPCLMPMPSCYDCPEPAPCQPSSFIRPRPKLSRTVLCNKPCVSKPCSHSYMECTGQCTTGTSMEQPITLVSCYQPKPVCLQQEANTDNIVTCTTTQTSIAVQPEVQCGSSQTRFTQNGSTQQSGINLQCNVAQTGPRHHEAQSDSTQQNVSSGPSQQTSRRSSQVQFSQAIQSQLENTDAVDVKKINRACQAVENNCFQPLATGVFIRFPDLNGMCGSPIPAVVGTTCTVNGPCMSGRQEPRRQWEHPTTGQAIPERRPSDVTQSQPAAAPISYGSSGALQPPAQQPPSTQNLQTQRKLSQVSCGNLGLFVTWATPQEINETYSPQGLRETNTSQGASGPPGLYNPQRNNGAAGPSGTLCPCAEGAGPNSTNGLQSISPGPNGTYTSAYEPQSRLDVARGTYGPTPNNYDPQSQAASSPYSPQHTGPIPIFNPQPMGISDQVGPRYGPQSVPATYVPIAPPPMQPIQPVPYQHDQSTATNETFSAFNPRSRPAATQTMDPPNGINGRQSMGPVGQTGAYCPPGQQYMGMENNRPKNQCGQSYAPNDPVGSCGRYDPQPTGPAGMNGTYESQINVREMESFRQTRTFASGGTSGMQCPQPMAPDGQTDTYHPNGPDSPGFGGTISPSEERGVNPVDTTDVDNSRLSDMATDPVFQSTYENNGTTGYQSRDASPKETGRSLVTTEVKVMSTSKTRKMAVNYEPRKTYTNEQNFDKEFNAPTGTNTAERSKKDRTLTVGPNTPENNQPMQVSSPERVYRDSPRTPEASEVKNRSARSKMPSPPRKAPEQSQELTRNKPPKKLKKKRKSTEKECQNSYNHIIIKNTDTAEQLQLNDQNAESPSASESEKSENETTEVLVPDVPQSSPNPTKPANADAGTYNSPQVIVETPPTSDANTGFSKPPSKKSVDFGGMMTTRVSAQDYSKIREYSSGEEGDHGTSTEKSSAVQEPRRRIICTKQSDTNNSSDETRPCWSQNLGSPCQPISRLQPYKCRFILPCDTPCKDVEYLPPPCQSRPPSQKRQPKINCRPPWQNVNSGRNARHSSNSCEVQPPPPCERNWSQSSVKCQCSSSSLSQSPCGRSPRRYAVRGPCMYLSDNMNRRYSVENLDCKKGKVKGYPCSPKPSNDIAECQCPTKEINR